MNLIKGLSLPENNLNARQEVSLRRGSTIPGCKFRASEIIVKVDKLWFYDKITSTQAEVAELADALGSGLSGLTLVRVQVPPSALFLSSGILVSSGCLLF